MVSLEGQEFHQFRVDEEFLAAEGHFGEHADFGQLLEITGGSLSCGDAGLGDILDAAVRLLEHQIHQLPGIDFRGGGPHVFDGVKRELADGLD